jgi:hypothetical protein
LVWNIFKLKGCENYILENTSKSFISLGNFNNDKQTNTRFILFSHSKILGCDSRLRDQADRTPIGTPSMSN